MAALLSMVSLVGGSIDRTEHLCEEAHAKLKECCGESFKASAMSCTNGACTTPELDMGTSECILDLSCEKIVDADICRRALDSPETGGPARCP